MDKKFLRLKGLSISKEDFELRYNVSLSDLEWHNLINSCTSSWEDHIEELKLMAFKHIKESMNSIGYRVALEEKDIIFQKIK
ncbi:hypothetical protein [Ekhidna sp.]